PTPGTVTPGASLVFGSRSVDVGYSRLRIMPPLPLPLAPGANVIAKPTSVLALNTPGAVVLPGGPELTLKPMPANALVPVPIVPPRHMALCAGTHGMAPAPLPSLPLQLLVESEPSV